MNPEANMTPPQEAFKSDMRLIAGLLQIIVALSQELQALRIKVAAMEKDSSCSHKPPSSDGLNKKRRANKRGSSGRMPGGQKGHRGRTRRNVPPDQVTETIPHQPQVCEQCGAAFTEQHLSVAVERRQVWEIPDIKPLAGARARLLPNQLPLWSYHPSASATMDLLWYGR